MEKKIRVLVVDDSAAIRQLLTTILSADSDIEVIGTASDPYVAREKIKALRPDVLTLDVEMPRMDGLTFLEKLMRGHPMPVVMLSSLTQNGCEITLRALEIGAIDFFPKPTLETLRGVSDGAEQICAKVKAAANARIRLRLGSSENGKAAPAAAAAPARAATVAFRMTHSVIAIGASTGGTEAIREVLCALPPACPGIVITQHMPPGFTASFAKRLDGLCALNVSEARDGDRVLPGHALIAPGALQTELIRNGAEYRVRVYAGPPVNRHCPSVDTLFLSAAAHAGKNAVGVILTGMGDDGARGLLALREAGARTVAQDQASCVVYGMPREAVERGAAEFVLPLSRIAERVQELAASAAA